MSVIREAPIGRSQPWFYTLNIPPVRRASRRLVTCLRRWRTSSRQAKPAKMRHLESCRRLCLSRDLQHEFAAVVIGFELPLRCAKLRSRRGRCFRWI